MEMTIAPIEPITDGQIGRLSDRFKEKCRKNAHLFSKEASQNVLEHEGDELVQEMFEAFRTRVERCSKMIVRRVTVDRDLSPKQVIDATGRAQYVDSKILATMPHPGTGTEEVDVYFFNVGRFLSIDEWDKELAAAGLEPDYYAQAQVNIDDPAFADEHPNGAQWDNQGGRASYVAFNRDVVGRSMGVGRGSGAWVVDWWLAGVRKPQTLGQ